jgi:uncharacterized membrane protein
VSDLPGFDFLLLTVVFVVVGFFVVILIAVVLVRIVLNVEIGHRVGPSTIRVYEAGSAAFGFSRFGGGYVDQK